MERDDPAIRWLLKSKDPSVRCFTLTELLDVSGDTPEVISARAQIPKGPRMRALLTGQKAAARVSRRSLATHAGGFGVHPYKKWDGAHWRLVSAVELGIPSDDPRARAAADQVLHWLTGEAHRSRIVCIAGRVRRCASQEGNALAVCSRLRLTNDPRVKLLAQSLIEWQWPDGGWNCDKHPTAQHSSFYESLAPLWGLNEYYRATGDVESHKAAKCAAEMFLSHGLFRSHRSDEIIDTEWLKLHYPLYWHYDILQALVMLLRIGKLNDPRAHEALDIVAAKRQADGTWHAEGYYWQSVGKRTSNVDVVDWGRRGPNEMLTLNALRVLRATGRIE
jgi:hypothetical protein